MYDESNGLLDDLRTDADECYMTSSSDKSMSEIESSEPDLQQQIQEENETSGSKRETEEPLYEGSKISKVLSFALIRSFVLQHNFGQTSSTY